MRKKFGLAEVNTIFVCDQLSFLGRPAAQKKASPELLHIRKKTFLSGEIGAEAAPLLFHQSIFSVVLTRISTITTGKINSLPPV